ncbi:MAG: hypothetical protein DRP67_00910 [Candidatus Omnitrophota bacterium]|nr:MAG: hypothetical protein DRP67_00910 [Candidatus Omnitrophota bacterium]
MKKYKNLAIILLLFSFTLYGDYKSDIKKGTLLLKTGKIQESINFFKNAIDENPSSSEAYYYLGYAYFLLGEKDKSLKNYEKAVQLDPENPDYHYALASLLISIGDKEKGIKELEETIRVSPESLAAKMAERLKKKIEKEMKEEELVKKWEKKVKEFKKTTTKKGKKIKIPLEKLVKRLKYATESRRKEASAKILYYPPTALKEYVSDFILLMRRENNPETIKNIIKIIAKTNTPEGVKGLRNFLEDFVWGIVEKKDANNIVFTLIVTLGEIRDTDSLDIIKDAWKKYGTKDREIYYYLTLARLGDYSHIGDLKKRLKEDYKGEKEKEIKLRSGIIEVIGEYLTKHSDPELENLICFLSEDALYPEIKAAAQNAFATFRKSVKKRD